MTKDRKKAYGVLGMAAGLMLHCQHEMNMCHERQPQSNLQIQERLTLACIETGKHLVML